MQCRQKPPCAGHLMILALCSLLSTTVLSQYDLNHNHGEVVDSGDDSSSVADWEQPDYSYDDELSSGSWGPVFEPEESKSATINPQLEECYSSVRKLVDSVGGSVEDVVLEIELNAAAGNPHAQSLLGFLYSFGVGRARNGAKAFTYHHFAADSGNIHSKLARAYGYYRKEAKEYFEKAAENKESGGHYNLGVMYLKGIGVKKDVKIACKFFIMAANSGQPKAFYQLAKMFHTGIVLKKNLPMATSLYKLVAERGPWNSLSRWALESYVKGEIGKAFLLYSRMAELGYEVAQSNAAWILGKYGESSMCIGELGLCTDAERHQRAHSLWWQASKQGNEYAALLIGDASYYDPDMEMKRDYPKTKLGKQRYAGGDDQRQSIHDIAVQRFVSASLMPKESAVCQCTSNTSSTARML